MGLSGQTPPAGTPTYPMGGCSDCYAHTGMDERMKNLAADVAKLEIQREQDHKTMATLANITVATMINELAKIKVLIGDDKDPSEGSLRHSINGLKTREKSRIDGRRQLAIKAGLAILSAAAGGTGIGYVLVKMLLGG